MRDNTPLTGRRSFGALLTTGLLTAILSLPAHAEYNPRANPVPGGVIVIELPNSIGEGVPEAYFRGKRVYTMNRAYNKRSDDRWVAWVGLSQNLGAGKHSLDIRQPGGKNRSVYIDVVEPEYNGEKRLASRAPLRTDLTSTQRQTIAKDEQQINSVIQNWSNGEPDSRPFLHPTNGKILKPFGQRIFYNQELVYNHNSVDLSGQRVIAPASGRIALIKDMFYQGTHVVLDHGSGLFTQYSHLQAVNFRIREGQWINRGEEIGKIGTTGKQIIFGKSFAAPITTPHLGFSVSLNGEYVNPELFLTPARAQ